jgi:hypothetical protein
MSDKVKQETTRRAFFRSVGLGAGAAGVVAVAKTAGVEAATAPEETGAGYRETEHVKTVYKLARF